MKTVLETLEAARKLITPRGAWIQGNFAQTKDGMSCRSIDADACKWCAQGAINRAAIRADREQAYRFMESVIGSDIVTFNDKAKSKKEVLRAFDAAIEKARTA